MKNHELNKKKRTAESISVLPAFNLPCVRLRIRQAGEKEEQQGGLQ